jgi:thioredoxin-related protein
MKNFLILFSFMFLLKAGFSQDMKKFNLYHPEEKAAKEIEMAVKEAKKQNKHVLIQVGGNWCIWCARFNDFVTKDKSLDSLVQENYIVYHLNYSKENKNGTLLKKYAFPQRFGFPVFLVLNQKGDLIHTQNSSYLEEGKGYNKEKVAGFLSDWTPKALDPALYKDDQ